MVLFLHHRYRTTGGEERVVEDLRWLVREHLGEDEELLARGSADSSRARAAAGLLRGGLAPTDVARAVRLTQARIVHAHNLLPTLGWRALAAARSAGARVVLHLHQFRLVCAIGVCFTEGQECTRCHARNTLPGVRLRCRGSLPEALVYGASLALWQQRLLDHADAVVVPSRFALERLRELGVALPDAHVLAPPLRAAGEAIAAPRPEAGSYALLVGRLSPEKGAAVAIDACRIARMPLVIAGEGPSFESLREHAREGDVRFVGRVRDDELAELRAGAAIALAPSLAPETFGLAAAEAMAAGLPVAASAVGAHRELLDGTSLVAPGDARALAGAISRLAGDGEQGRRNAARVGALCAPAAIAPRLAAIYDGREPPAAST